MEDAYDIPNWGECWGWYARRYIHIWQEDEYGGWWGGQITDNGWSRDSELYGEWMKYAQLAAAVPDRPGNYDGETVERTVWVWLCKEHSSSENWAETYPEHGTIVTENPASTHKGICGWYVSIHENVWGFDGEEGCWYDEYVDYYPPYGVKAEDIDWEGIDYSIRPDRDGAYIGEKVVIKVWIWVL